MTGTNTRRVAGLAALVVTVGLPVSLAEARYRWRLRDVARLPMARAVPAPPEFSVLPAWRQLGGEGDPSVPALYAWRLDLLRDLHSPKDPGLLAARRVAWAYLCMGTWDAPCNPGGDPHEARVQALTIWLSRHWTVRQILAAYHQLGQPRIAQGRRAPVAR